MSQKTMRLIHRLSKQNPRVLKLIKADYKSRNAQGKALFRKQARKWVEMI